MKKFFFSLLVVLLAGSLTLTAATKNDGKGAINLFADVGVAFSDFEGLFFDLGAQYGLTEKIFGEFLFEFYPDPSGENGGGYSYKAFGFNLNAVYKHPLSEGLVVFGKAGLNLLISSWSGEIWGIDFSESDSNFGLNAGAGVEYGLSEALALRGGITLKLLFAEGETGTWFKLYGGVLYRLK